MGKTLDDAPARAKEVVMARALAAKNAGLEMVEAVYGKNAGEYLRSLPKPDLQRAVCELMMAGLSMSQCAEIVGIGKGTISKWFSAETTEMQKLMKTALTRDALLEMPKTWFTLKDARDSENEETKRKAALDCMRAAGLPVDPGAGAVGGVSIHAQNLQFNNLSVADLDQKILEIAGKLGPEAMKFADAEVKGHVSREGTRPGADAAAAPGAEADADGGVPRSPGGAPSA